MNKFLYYLLIGLTLIVSSCAKDKSNYTYNTEEYIEIEGIEDKYTAVAFQDTIKIEPQISSNKDGDLEYSWGIYETNVQGRSAPVDTISHTKNLKYAVHEDAKDWVLVFLAKNKRTGYTQYKTTTLTVATAFTRGWYILKDDGANSDLDLFLTPQSIMVNGKIENAFSTANGSKLQGKASNFSFTSAYKSNILNPTTYANTRTLFITTEKDVQAVGINNLKTIRDKSTLFIGGDQNIAPPVSAFVGNSAIYLMNRGELYNIYSNSVNKGQFGSKVRYDDNNSSYSLSPYFASQYSVDPILFDNNSSSFVTLVNGSGSTLTTFSNVDGNTLPTVRNNKTALYLGFKSTTYLPAPDYYSKRQGYAILKDKTDPSLKSLCFLEGDRTKLTIKSETLSPSSLLQNASLYTLLTEDENLLYFVTNNNVYSRNLSNGFEQLQYAVPSGEQVTFIKHLKYAVTTEPEYNFNFFIIGSKSGSNYKIRMFKKNSGNLESVPTQILEGTGSARSILYISPRVSESSYPSTY